jgi:hypothetical protein
LTLATSAVQRRSIPGRARNEIAGFQTIPGLFIAGIEAIAYQCRQQNLQQWELFQQLI